MRDIQNIRVNLGAKKISLYSLNLMILLFLITNINSLTSQVLISNTTGIPDSTAILEVRSTAKGFLPPRMTEIERDLIVNPTAGLIIYCSNCLEMQMYNDTAWTNMIGLPPALAVWQCGDSLAYDGQSYATVQIGGQCWMAENLNVGTMILASTNQTNNSTIEKYCYNDDAANCTTYGALYEWDEMMQYTTIASTQGICPTDWHLPSDDEYKTLEMQLGMTQAQADSMGYRGTNQGSQVAGNEVLWNDGNLDQNANFGNSGFAGLPAGLSFTAGAFGFLSAHAEFWSSNELGGNGWQRRLVSNSTKVYRTVSNKNMGYSVRCVRD